MSFRNQHYEMHVDGIKEMAYLIIKKGNEIEEGKEGNLDNDCSVRRQKYIKFKRREEKAQIG